MTQVYDFEVLEFDTLRSDIHCGITTILKRKHKNMHAYDKDEKYLETNQHIITKLFGKLI